MIYIYIVYMQRLLCKSRVVGSPFLQSGSNFFGFSGMIAWSVTSLHVKICNLGLSRTTIHNGIKHAESFTDKTGLKHCLLYVFAFLPLLSIFRFDRENFHFRWERERERRKRFFNPKESKGGQKLGYFNRPPPPPPPPPRGSNVLFVRYVIVRELGSIKYCLTKLN